MSAGPGPIPPPPQLSPDGKYVWDGSEWRPIAGAVEVSHGAVFKAWNSIQVEPADPVAAAAPPTAVQFPAAVQVQTPVQEPEPVIDYSSYAVAEPSGPIVPLWQQQRSTGINKILYAGAGIVVVAMGLILLNYLNLQLPWSGAASSSSAQSVKPSPSPDFSGTDYVRANRFLTTSLAPSLASLEKAVTPLNRYCYQELTNSCFDALTATEQQMKSVLAVVQNGDIPRCIGAPMAKVTNSMQQMEQQLQVALTGFKENSSDGLYTGVYRFNTYHRYMYENLSSATQATKADCHKMVLPTWVP